MTKVAENAFWYKAEPFGKSIKPKCAAWCSAFSKSKLLIISKRSKLYNWSKPSIEWLESDLKRICFTFTTGCTIIIHNCWFSMRSMHLVDKMVCPISKSVLKWNLVYFCTSQFTIADFKCDWCIWWQNVHSRQCHLNIMRMQNPHFNLTWAACSRYASMTHLQLDNWYGLWNRHCKNHVMIQGQLQIWTEHSTCLWFSQKAENLKYLYYLNKQLMYFQSLNKFFTFWFNLT